MRLLSKAQGQIRQCSSESFRSSSRAFVGQQLIDLHPRFCYTSDVAATVDLQQMSVADKLRLMEALWRDLSAKDTEVVSPEWHRDVLEERDRKIVSGEESFIDWEVAKKKLREEVQ